MRAARRSAAVKGGVRSALAARDFVALEDLLARTPLRSAEHELLLRFPALRGGSEILQAAGGLVRNRRAGRGPAGARRGAGAPGGARPGAGGGPRPWGDSGIGFITGGLVQG